MENKKKTVIAIIQAHMSSTRLPGKVMKDLCGAPALYRMIERVRHCKNLDDIVIATSTKPCDDIIVDACKEWGVHIYRGSDSDVLSRYWETARQYPADNYVRLTSDCPLISFEFVDALIEYFNAHHYRYVGNGWPEKVNDVLPNGCAGEMFTAELLDEAMKNADKDYEHEHVSPYMVWKQDSVGYLPFLDRDASNYRITLDTPEDYEVICKVYEALYKPGNDFTLYDILDYLDHHPEVVAINSMIVQKKAR